MYGVRVEMDSLIYLTLSPVPNPPLSEIPSMVCQETELPVMSAKERKAEGGRGVGAERWRE